MNLAPLIFYMLAGVLLTSAILVVLSKNTVHGVLFLILAFVNAAGLFVMAQAEFLAMMLVIVYVGAVAVLFLFVVMMLNMERPQFMRSLKSYTLSGLVVGGVLILELFIMVGSWTPVSDTYNLTMAPLAYFEGKTNTQVLGNLIYTHYALVFQGAGVVLLIAMIGAIVLTLRHREGVKRQKIKDQVGRHPRETLSLVDIPLRSGS